MQTPTGFFAIFNNWETLSVNGPDARDFLNRLTTADFKRLVKNSFSPAALLQATGKIVLYFKVLALDTNAYLILVPQSDTPNAAQTAHDILEKMHFREDLKIEVQAKAWAYLRIFGKDPAVLKKLSPSLQSLYELATAPKGSMARLEGGLYAFNESRWTEAPIQFDIGLLVPRSEDLLKRVSKMLADAGLALTQDHEAYRIRAADPAVPNELTPTTIPLEANLADAVHENKGCYPGQEVIERIRSMGQVPRFLSSFEGQGALPTLPTAVKVAGQDAGTITSAAQNPLGSGWVGLGFIKRLFVKTEGSYTIVNADVEQEVRVKVHAQ